MNYKNFTYVNTVYNSKKSCFVCKINEKTKENNGYVYKYNNDIELKVFK